VLQSAFKSKSGLPGSQTQECTDLFPSFFKQAKFKHCPDFTILIVQKLVHPDPQFDLFAPLGRGSAEGGFDVMTEAAKFDAPFSRPH
jgi:hypothetical protein